MTRDQTLEGGAFERGNDPSLQIREVPVLPPSTSAITGPPFLEHSVFPDPDSFIPRISEDLFRGLHELFISAGTPTPQPPTRKAESETALISPLQGRPAGRPAGGAGRPAASRNPHPVGLGQTCIFPLYHTVKKQWEILTRSALGHSKYISCGRS